MLVVLSREEVERLLPMSDCIHLMSDALIALARGQAFNPLRSMARPPGVPHFMGLMPAYRGGSDPVYALKEVCIFPDNPERGLDPHQGAVLLHSARRLLPFEPPPSLVWPRELSPAPIRRSSPFWERAFKLELISRP